MRRATFRQIRKRLKLTQAELAKVLRVHTRTVSKWEQGGQSIPGPVTVLMERLDKEAKESRKTK